MPEVMLTEAFPVVAREDDRGATPATGVPHRFEKRTDMLVDVAHLTVVAVVDFRGPIRRPTHLDRTFQEATIAEIAEERVPDYVPGVVRRGRRERPIVILKLNLITVPLLTG